MRKIEIIQGDCMEVMAQYPDKYSIGDTLK